MSTEKDLRSRQTGTALAGLALIGLGWWLGQLAVDAEQLAGLPSLAEVVDGPLVGLGVAALVVAIVWAVWSSLPTVRLRRKLGAGGWAGWRDLRSGLGAGGLRRTYGSEVRPDLKGRRAPATEYGLPVGRLVTGPLGVRGRQAYFPHSYSVLVSGPPGAAKSSELANFVRTAPGSAYVSTTKTEFVKHTAELRSFKGRVWVFNPAGLGGVPSTFGWNPVEGCYDQKVAKERAEAMVRGGAAVSNEHEFFKQKAVEIIRCYLMAAALEGLGMAAVHEWATHPDDPTPVDILRKYPNFAPGTWVSTLESYLDGDPKTRSNYYATVTPCVSFLDNPAVIMACNPPSDQRFNLEEFLTGTDTLYVINGEDSSLAPLMTALTEHIQSGARAAAASSPHERLTPGLHMILDEIAQTTPVPLDKWSSELRGHGVTVVAGMQGRAQLEKRYGREATRTICNSMTMKIVVSAGMMSDEDDLNYFCGLAGPRWVTKYSHGETESNHGSSKSTNRQRVEEPVLTPNRLKRLPRGYAFIDGPGEHTAVVRFPRGFPRAQAEARRLARAATRQAQSEARAAERARETEPAPTVAEPIEQEA